MTSPWCPYCVDGGASEPFNADHVIPAKLGGTLEIPTHVRCNSRAAIWVDNPLMADPEVEILRALSGVRNTRRRGAVKGAQFRTDLEDAAPALLRADIDGVEIVQVGAGAPVAHANGLFTFSLAPGPDLERRLERVLAQMRAAHPGKTVTLSAQESRRTEVTADRTARIRRDVWPRFAAKVALGVLSLTMPCGWRGSDGWACLLALFASGQVVGSTKGKGIVALPRTLSELPERSFWRSLYPWEHVIAVQPGAGVGAVAVTIVLFGELVYELGVVTPLQPQGPRIWVLDFREKTPLAFHSLDAFLLTMLERREMFGEFSKLRHNRPTRRVLDGAVPVLHESSIIGMAGAR